MEVLRFALERSGLRWTKVWPCLSPPLNGMRSICFKMLWDYLHQRFSHLYPRFCILCARFGEVIARGFRCIFHRAYYFMYSTASSCVVCACVGWLLWPWAEPAKCHFPILSCFHYSFFHLSFSPLSILYLLPVVKLGLLDQSSATEKIIELPPPHIRTLI